MSHQFSHPLERDSSPSSIKHSTSSPSTFSTLPPTTPPPFNPSNYTNQHPLGSGSGTSLPNVRSSMAISSLQQDGLKNFLRGKEFPLKTKKRVQDISNPSSLDSCADLAKHESWKEMLKLCEKQLQLPGKPNENLQWRLCQLTSLLRLNLADYAAQCVDMMGDLENNSTFFYEKYPNIYSISDRQKKAGNMMPFSILIVKAIVPLFQFVNNPATLQQQHQQVIQQQQTKTENAPNLPPVPDGSAIALERLYSLLKLCSDQIKDDAGNPVEGVLYSKRCRLHTKNQPIYTPFEGTQEEWRIREQRVVFYIVTCHIARKEYYLALQIMEKILKYYSSMITTDFATYQRLESLTGCLYLQQGLTKAAKEHFVNVEKREPNSERSIMVRANSGHLKFAYGQYVDASKEFSYILSNLDPLNINAANNKAICLLYMCELTKAIETLEEFIRQDPSETLDENLVYNLCTMYDLESTESNEKKMIISSLAHRFKGDDFVNWIVQ